MNNHFKLNKIAFLLIFTFSSIFINSNFINATETGSIPGSVNNNDVYVFDAGIEDPHELTQDEKDLLSEILEEHVTITKVMLDTKTIVSNGVKKTVMIPFENTVEIPRKQHLHDVFVIFGSGKKGKNIPKNALVALKHWCQKSKHNFFSDLIMKEIEWPGAISDNLKSRLCACNLFGHLSAEKEIIDWPYLKNAFFKNATLDAIKETEIATYDNEGNQKLKKINKLFKNFEKLSVQDLVIIYMLIINPQNTSEMRSKHDKIEGEISKIRRLCKPSAHSIGKEIMNVWFKINSNSSDVSPRKEYCICRVLSPNFGLSTHHQPKDKANRIGGDTYRDPKSAKLKNAGWCSCLCGKPQDDDGGRKDETDNEIHRYDNTDRKDKGDEKD